MIFLRGCARCWSAAVCPSGLAALLIFAALSSGRSGPAALGVPCAGEPDRSPVDCALTPDERWLATANQTSETVSLVDLSSGKVVDEQRCGARPTALAISPDGKRLVATAAYSHEVVAYDIHPEGKLRESGRRWIGFEPHGIIIDAEGKRLYVALTTAHAIAVLDAQSLEEKARIPVGRWPRHLALANDGKLLVAGCSGDQAMALVDLVKQKLLRLEPFDGLNQGQMAISPDGEFVYAPYIYHFGSSPTERTIKLGWVTTSRIARIRIHTPKRVASLYLDTQGEAVADPCGMAFSPDQKWLVCTASGTHELLIFKNQDLPFQGFNSRFLIDEELRTDAQRYARIPLGGRPMLVKFSKDSRHLYVANYLLNAVQVVDVIDRKLVRTLELGGPKEASLIRQGEAIFYDGWRGLDHWYSCASCHYEGHSNGIAMDTANDGRLGNPKMVPSLRYVAHTGPWTWHGWQKSLPEAMRKSMKDTMLGKPLTEREVDALVAYLGTLEGPPNPHRGPDQKHGPAVQRGREVFRSEKAGCARCHAGAHLTDDKVHEVGLESPGDRYRGFNPPTLRGVYDRMKYLHDGRAATLEELLRGPHAPEKVTGKGKLTDEELRDLLEYLKSL